MWAIDNPNARKIIEDYARFGQPIPDGLTPPDLHDVEYNIWMSFWNLSTERSIGFTSGPIPVSKISECAKNQGVPESIFCAIIRSMDDVYLNYKSGESVTFSRDMMRS